MKLITDGYAPPARVWGPWKEVGSQFGGPSTWKVSFESISDAPSSFEAEISYFSGGMEKRDLVLGPNSHTFTAGICVCVSKIRFRSHSIGQMIKIYVH